MSPDAGILASARHTAAAVRAGTLSARQVAEAFALRIAEREAQLGAWAYFDRARALAEADGADVAGPLAGVAIGVKDVIDTADMPTGYGSALYHGARPRWDASCVAIARSLGAVMLGKTVATEFAMSSPGPTRNPFNAAHTPGGSSSGSCAAVAAGMAHAAFGTQTSGSLIRPAAYCGVVGYKPSFGLVDRTGVKPLSDSLDTVGIVTRNVRDAAFFTASLAGVPGLEVAETPRPPRLGWFRTSRWAQLEPASAAAMERAAAAARRAGATVRELPVPDWFEGLYACHDAVMGWETPRALAFEYRRHADAMTPVTRAFLDQLSNTTRAEYERAVAACARRGAWLEELLDGCDALVAPAAPGEAPAGLEATGDPVFNKIWTLLHGPCVAVPAGRGGLGLPVAVQVCGRIGDDAGVLAAAAFVEDSLAAGMQS